MTRKPKIERITITPADKCTPPPFPGAEAFEEADKKYMEWEQSEEGQKFLKEHLPPEAWEREFGGKE